MITSKRSLWLMAASQKNSAAVRSAALLKDARGQSLTAWEQDLRGMSVEQAALQAIVVGLRAARAQRADRVTVLCGSADLVARLNRLTRTEWNDPLARLWVQARALSHAFERCEFRVAEAADLQPVLELAARRSLEVDTARAA